MNKSEFTCENPKCKNIFKRTLSDTSLHNFCSRSCAVAVNNSKFPKKIAIFKKCNYCRKGIIRYGKLYCSFDCRVKATTMTQKEIIKHIKEFYKIHGRVPLKREFNHPRAARDRFGTWNKAIEAAGFKPNPVLFADNCQAKDGHTCNSIAEMVIDDYLFENKIEHERNVKYPEGMYTADFKIGNRFIEYFGLSGEHKRYDELKRIKQRIANKYKLNLIEVYPKDLYPQNKISDLL